MLLAGSHRACTLGRRSGGGETRAQAPPPGLIAPLYTIDMTAIDPNTDMTLGSLRMVFDTGAGGTTLSRANAMTLGLLDAAGNPVAALDSEFRVNTRNANAMIVAELATSIGLRLSATGKDAAGRDIGTSVFPVDEKNLAYPLRGVPEIGTRFGTTSSESCRPSSVPLASTCGTVPFCRPTQTGRLRWARSR
jgi:hypothetical protein